MMGKRRAGGTKEGMWWRTGRTYDVCLDKHAVNCDASFGSGTETVGSAVVCDG